MEGYDEEQTEYSLNTKLLADGSDFPVVPNGQARREHHKGESFLPPPHMMTAGAQEKALAKGRTSNPSPPEDSYSLAGESSYMFTFLMWFMFVAHAGCMTYALTVTSASPASARIAPTPMRPTSYTTRRAAPADVSHPSLSPTHSGRLESHRDPRAANTVRPDLPDWW